MIIACQVTVNVHTKAEIAVRSALSDLKVGEDYDLLFVEVER